MSPKTAIEKAIIKTLAYRDLFDYPLTAEEIWRFLIEEKASPSVVNKTLARLVTEGRVENTGRYYFLPRRGEIVKLRARRQVVSQPKLKKTISYTRLLCLIPWVKGVFATGALAAENAQEDSDLDILIVASNKRVWLVRLISTVLLDLLGVRIKVPHKTKNRVCPNIFLSETALEVRPNEQNLYAAHEVVQAKPLWEKGPFHQRFLAENRWIGAWLPNVNLPSRSDKPLPKKGIFLLDWLEAVVYRLQIKYMEKKRTQETVTPERILFHQKDLAAEILANFQTNLDKLL